MHRDLKLKNMMLHFPENEKDLMGQDEKELIQGYKDNMTSKIKDMMKSHTSQKNHVYHRKSGILISKEDLSQEKSSSIKSKAPLTTSNYAHFRSESRKKFIRDIEL